ncbi:MAG: hypothetical protein DHS20C15_04040 [Planctomycetota bacterium]|nr:MAG: hypothetical protein DHS20C15_04040 [Planctomycetota bacterium]
MSSHVQSIQVLVISPDDTLSAEVRDALERVRDVSGHVHAERELRRGLEWARDHRPDLVVVSAEGGAASLRAAGEGVFEASRESLVVAAYRSHEIDEPGALIPAVRASVRDFLQRPVSSLELGQVLERLLESGANATAGGRVVSFVSNKGGAGKSTLAVNTATLLATRHPGRVLLIDASLQLGVCASLLDLACETTLADAARQTERLDDALLRTLSVEHECGLRVLAAPRDALDAADVDEQAISRIITVARRSFDVVIVDTFPMVDSVALAILDLSDLVEIVISGLVPNVLGAEAFVRVLGQLGLPEERQRLVLNATHPSFSGSLRPRDVASRLDRTLHHVIPYSRRALAAVNSGRPAVLRLGRFGRFGRFGRGVAGVVDEIEALPQRAGSRGLLSPDRNHHDDSVSAEHVDRLATEAESLGPRGLRSAPDD